MLWKNAVFSSLDEQGLFQDAAHRTRFKELLNCYADAPFFTPGLCKCMYMSCWDEEHFIIMLDMLNQLRLGTNMDLSDMLENGELMAEENPDHYDAYVLQLSCAFLAGHPFDVTSLPENLDKKGLYIITESLKAAQIIDHIKLPQSS